MSPTRQADPELDSLIGEIIIDCDDEDEQLTAFETAFDEDASFPCPAHRHRRGRRGAIRQHHQQPPRADRRQPTRRTPLRDRTARHRHSSRPNHLKPPRCIPALDRRLGQHPNSYPSASQRRPALGLTVTSIDRYTARVPADLDGIPTRQRRGMILLAAAAAAVVLAPGGCSKGSGPPLTAVGRAIATTPAPSQRGPDRIRAVPNPVASGPNVGTTTITWVAPGARSVEVRVSMDGGAGKLFAEGGSVGSAVAPFITANHNFAFQLFPDASAHALATVIVKRR
jgi:hypothetical protein